MTTCGRMEIYEAADGWRWRFIASNGEPLCHGGEAFSSKQSCYRSVETVVRYMVGYDRHGLLIENNDIDDKK